MAKKLSTDKNVPPPTLIGKLYRHQQGIKAFGHFVLFTFSYYFSFGFRFNFAIPSEYWAFLWTTWPVLIAIKLLIFWRLELFRVSLRYFSTRDAVNLLKASALSTLGIMLVIFTLFLRQGFPRSILFMDLILTLTFVGGVRFSIRMVRESLANRQNEESKRVVIIGAGDAGESLLREINKNANMNYKVVSFFDDNPSKIGINISGVPVNGPINNIKEYASRHKIELLFIAVPSAKRDKMRRIVELCRETHCKVQTIPGMDQLLDGKITVSQLRDVQIEDLLPREPVNMDVMAISLYLQGKSVLVTGAAGSIGSEICRQALRFNPRKLIMFDQAESAMFELNGELTASNTATEILPSIGDICDRRRVEFIMDRYKPDVVFHAAAYKHVPIMETNPTEAVKNNVLGTKIVADLAQINGVKRFVYISTDKAVNPTSVMGATKRIAELYLQGANSLGGTKYIMVRFGNVLDSAGSVIPIFRKQIARGGPVTVTHPEMTRYFMTIPEATQLVLQAAAMGQGGEIYVLDMGEPAKILDLAKEMIRLSGYTPDEDIPIVFTGIRPGEKLYEELWYQDDIEPTRNNKIFVKDPTNNLPSNFEKVLESILAVAMNGTHESIQGIKRKIAEMVPEYKGIDL